MRQFQYFIPNESLIDRLEEFNTRIGYDEQLIKDRVGKHLLEHKKRQKIYIRFESDSRKKLDKMRKWTRARLYIQSIKNEIRSQQDWVKSNKRIVRELERLQRQLREKFEVFHQQIEGLRIVIQQRNQQQSQQKQKGLTAARIQQFHQFPADESLVGERCNVCFDDIEVGRTMVRLDCDSPHVFCKNCVEGWFKDHKTCPNCRHEFK